MVLFDVEAIHPEKLSEHELLHLAAHVERYSTHPIALALRMAYTDERIIALLKIYKKQRDRALLLLLMVRL